MWRFETVLKSWRSLYQSYISSTDSIKTENGILSAGRLHRHVERSYLITRLLLPPISKHVARMCGYVVMTISVSLCHGKHQSGTYCRVRASQTSGALLPHEMPYHHKLCFIAILLRIYVQSRYLVFRAPPWDYYRSRIFHRSGEQLHALGLSYSCQYKHQERSEMRASLRLTTCS